MYEITRDVIDDADALLRALRETGAHPNDIRHAVTVKGWFSDRVGSVIEASDVPGRGALDARVIELLRGTVSDVRGRLDTLSDAELRLAYEREPFVGKRSTLMAAFAAETERRRC